MTLAVMWCHNPGHKHCSCLTRGGRSKALYLLLQGDFADPVPGQGVTTVAGPAAGQAGAEAAGNHAGPVAIDEELRPATGTAAQASKPPQAKPAMKRKEDRSTPVESGTTSGSQRDADVTVCYVCCCCC